MYIHNLSPYMIFCIYRLNPNVLSITITGFISLIVHHINGKRTKLIGA